MAKMAMLLARLRALMVASPIESPLRSLVA